MKPTFMRLTGALLAAAMLLLSACSKPSGTDGGPSTSSGTGQTDTGQSGSGQGGSDTSQGAQPRRGPNGEVYGGVYRMAVGAEPAGIDPHIDTTLFTYRLSRNIFSTLVRYKGETLELEPELLAEMPAISPDGRTYSFRLKEGVKFHNGATLTAHDVKYTFERLLTPATKAANTWVLQDVVGADEMLNGTATELAGLKVTGDYTFEITLKQPFGPFLYYLATAPASIYPAEYAREKGDAFAREPVGTGPFRLKEWRENELLVLERNPDFFEEGYPFLDAIEYRVVADESTRWLEFEAGNLDSNEIPTVEWENATQSGRWKVWETTTLNTYYLSLQLEMVPDPRVREAISLAIDRQKIIDTIHNGTGTPAIGFTSPGIVGALTGAPGFPYDPDRARQLIKEAGAEGMTIVSWQRGGDKVTDSNLAIQQMLAEVGLNYVVEIYDSATFREARANGEIMANQGNWYADYPDPDNYLWTYFHSSSSRGMSVAMNDPEVDRILEEARISTDQAARVKAYQDLERKLLYEQYAIIPLWHLKSYFVSQPNVYGFKLNPVFVYDYKTVWKDVQ
ncbi:ABC transporter substrate-binding protein [Symbiobacterium terraclitae]|uniref:ABC transporter substrate-binding protein n=1 Tax=Symbiobacterium terraclitae TaxID=557451 RepID=UPI0035B548C4